MDSPDEVFANAFNLMPELGSVRLNKLLACFGSFKAAWETPNTDYKKAGLDDKTIDQIIARKKLINPERSFINLSNNGIKIILISNPFYPQRLKEISASPPILYIRGKMEALNTVSLAVVGTRNMSLYGKQAAQELVSELAQNNVAIVSGLAFGIDAEALNTCCTCGGMPIAVLASSIDDSSISPRSNLKLAQDIVKKGCLVSEYPPGVNVQKQNFPIRNRIISGLSVGTLVIEADTESGSLITANYALEQNREVFAVPGSIFSPVSRGTNDLIRQGAKLVTHVSDIIEELNLSHIETETQFVGQPDSESEKLVLSILTKQPVHIDDLIKSSGQVATEINAALSMLEINGRVKNLGGGNYIKVR